MDNTPNVHQFASTQMAIVPFRFISPAPLTTHLVDLGLSTDIAKRMSATYMSTAEKLKATVETTLCTTYAKLASLPRSEDSVPLDHLHQQIFDSQNRAYENTLSKWSADVTNLARSHVSRISPTPWERSISEPPRKTTAKKTRRQFKTEYLPLFEFAFEKDRFPNREDKKRLAKISGMSYRQVSVWFQNRRCRHAARAKSCRLTPAPQTFQEMKDRLGTSAREALSRIPSAVKEAAQDCATVSRLSDVQSATSSRINSLEALLQLISQSNALEVGTSGDILVSEGRDESEDYNNMDDAVHSAPRMSPIPNPALNPANPLNAFGTPKPNVFPAIYKPSMPTFDPFAVERGPWLRTPGAPPSRQFIDPTPEALEDIMAEFDGMEVDVPTSNSNDPTGPPDDSTERLPLALPGKRTQANPSPCIAPNSHPSAQRTFSSSSSDSSDSSRPSSSNTSATSRASSYSTAPSSVLSSPRHSDLSLPIECVVEVPSEYPPSPWAVPSPSADDGSVCGTPADELTTTGSFDLPSVESASKDRVDAWMWNVSTQPEKGTADDRWEQLLAAAVDAAPDS